MSEKCECGRPFPRDVLDPVLTLKELAAYLGTSFTTAWRRVADFEIECSDIGSGSKGKWRIRRSAADSYLDRQKIQPISRRVA